MASSQLEDAEMARKRHTAEEIVSKLRQVDVLTAQGRPVAEGVRAIGVSEVKLRDELLDGEVFYSLAEAKIVIEGWRASTPPTTPAGNGSWAAARPRRSSASASGEARASSTPVTNHRPILASCPRRCWVERAKDASQADD
jgi:hypothetical protein